MIYRESFEEYELKEIVRCLVGSSSESDLINRLAEDLAELHMGNHEHCSEEFDSALGIKIAEGKHKCKK